MWEILVKHGTIQLSVLPGVLDKCAKVLHTQDIILIINIYIIINLQATQNQIMFYLSKIISLKYWTKFAWKRMEIEWFEFKSQDGKITYRQRVIRVRVIKVRVIG